MLRKSTSIFVGSIRTRRLGRVWIACSPRGLVALDFGVSRAAFESAVRRRMQAEILPSSSRIQAVGEQIRRYLEGEPDPFSLKIDWSSVTSPFQRAVLKAVLAIPYGHTCTYAEIAQRIGHPSAPRAVGRANATNPMPLVIPCHRVIGSDGSLRGYGGAGGVRTKAWLIRMESARSAADRGGASALPRQGRRATSRP